MWIKAYLGCLYVVGLGSERALNPALFFAPTCDRPSQGEIT